MSKMLLFFLLFIGGSAGSTTGGMKIIRSILVVKYLLYEVRKLLHPKGVFNITIGENTIDDNVVRATLGFYLFYILIFVFTAMVLSMTGLDVTTALTASASAIGNIGPGLGSIGPTDNWGHLTDLAKWLTSFCMLLGRLEIFTVVVLFSRSFWK
jgi:trk system potassium uptake protein TrkH